MSLVSFEAAHFTMQSDDLAPIRAEDAGEFVEAGDLAGARSRRHYFPLLHFHGGESRLCWEKHGSSVLVYQIQRRQGGSRINLLMPPFPFDAAALRHAKERMQDFNKGARGRIIWLTEEEALIVVREGFVVFFKEEEYIFDRASVMAHAGPGFRKLRQELSRAVRAGDLVTTRPYRAGDQSACAALVDAWKQRLAAAGVEIGGYNLTLSCLAGAHRFDHPLLSGLVVEIDGVVGGFAFAGRISNAMGSNFLSITDTRFRGLPYLLCYRLMEAHPDLSYFNDSTDSGREGLREQKQRFQPIEMQGLYGARAQ